MQSHDESGLTLLPDARLRSSPYPHFMALRTFTPEVADAAHAWLDSHAPWRRHLTDFFDQFECNVLSQRLPSMLHDGLVSPATLRSLRRRMEALFSVRFADVFTVTAHRLVPGQGIGVHTDRPLPGYETHRMVVHLGPEFRDESGGHLLFFHSSDPSDFAHAFRTIHNTSIGFELSPNSFHAVAELATGVRYTLVYSFWRADCAEDAEPPARRIEDLQSPDFVRTETSLAPHAIGGGTLARQIHTLVEAGAALKPTPETAILPDLVHTYEVLRSWGCRDEVCLAGLFHGVYGTALAPEPLLRSSERERVQAAVGERAEALAHGGGAVDHASLKRALAAGDARSLVDRWRAAPLNVDRRTLVDLATLSMAHRVVRHARTRPTNEEWGDEQDLFVLARPHLDASVLKGLRRVYGG